MTRDAAHPQGARIPQLNDMVRSEQGVFQLASAEPFAYSDGVSTEQQLAKILENAQDLSSQSAELEAQICDWPTEYHLSAKRANLLRPLNLTGVKRVLELGCGCGAISRYLGEQDGLEVDAIEGSPVRAQLAAARCRDLDNVTVHCANFNEIFFPEKEYDLVLFIGVTEYAGRFSQQKTDQAALQELLALAKAALKPDGVAAIAIENRLGLKYVHGACEDHYAEPWVGLQDYPNSTGIRTYSHTQWQVKIAESGFEQSLFCYPFPDYKVPSALIHESDVCTAPAADAIAKTASRDYLRPFAIKHEAQLWQGLAQAGCVGELANSFLILLSSSSNRLSDMADFTVSEFDHDAYNWQTQAAAPMQAAPMQAAPMQAAAPLDGDKQRLISALGKVTEKNEQLQAELNLLKQSRGWRVLTRLRALLRRG